MLTIYVCHVADVVRSCCTIVSFFVKLAGRQQRLTLSSITNISVFLGKCRSSAMDADAELAVNNWSYS